MILLLMNTLACESLYNITHWGRICEDVFVCSIGFIWYSSNRFNPHGCLWLSNSKTSISNGLYHGRFCALLFELWYGSICWYWWNCWHLNLVITSRYLVLKKTTLGIFNYPCSQCICDETRENAYYQCKMNNRTRNNNRNEHTS